MTNLLNYYHRITYYFSPDRKILDYYIQRIRRLEKLTDSEVQRFKELAEYEKSLYEHKDSSNI